MSFLIKIYTVCYSVCDLSDTPSVNSGILMYMLGMKELKNIERIFSKDESCILKENTH